jgi:hypothetical protein
VLRSCKTLASAEERPQGTEHDRCAVAAQVFFVHRHFVWLSSLRFHRDLRPQQHRRAEAGINVVPTSKESMSSANAPQKSRRRTIGSSYLSLYWPITSILGLGDRSALEGIVLQNYFGRSGDRTVLRNRGLPTREAWRRIAGPRRLAHWSA